MDLKKLAALIDRHTSPLSDTGIAVDFNRQRLLTGDFSVQRDEAGQVTGITIARGFPFWHDYVIQGVASTDESAIHLIMADQAAGKITFRPIRHNLPLQHVPGFAD